MLTGSNVRFSDDHNRLTVEFEIKQLNDDALNSILDKTNYILDVDKLVLVEPRNKYKIALIYNVKLIDAQVGWLLQKMCLTSSNLGFVITPMTKWHRHRIIQCYKAIQGNVYKAHFDLSKAEKGYIYLVIDYYN